MLMPCPADDELPEKVLLSFSFTRPTSRHAISADASSIDDGSGRNNLMGLLREALQLRLGSAWEDFASGGPKLNGATPSDGVDWAAGSEL
eukprot:CAMPEP_0184380184 /NCGR_PEP_ID=MMETSP0007-20130409/4522_1 /TAXON_ID=97485 /ORGANISM="Prymnesium parvum, Strain Texoma1" /LENGTH=89 /DNA_ID=CAMNT_0026725283 /DNA_START=124 /DNA_END=391 /DNA_ORIENTATION=+